MQILHALYALTKYSGKLQIFRRENRPIRFTLRDARDRFRSIYFAKTVYFTARRYVIVFRE